MVKDIKITFTARLRINYDKVLDKEILASFISNALTNTLMDQVGCYPGNINNVDYIDSMADVKEK